MADPRRVLRGTAYLITRRCVLRQFLLRPAAERNEGFLYCLAEAANKFGILVHAFCFMSNHFHLVVTDVRGKLPEFMHRLDFHLAGCVNAELGRRGQVFESGSYDGIEVIDPGSMLDVVAYVLSNPVEAGLVSSGKVWPGLWSGVHRMEGKTFRARRPRWFFSRRGVMPKAASLRLRAPSKEFWPDQQGGVEGFMAAAAEKVAAKEEQCREEVKSCGGGFMGCNAVLEENPLKLATAEEKMGRRTKIACSDRARLNEELQRLRQFEYEYRQVYERYVSGDSGAVFPAGTYLLRVRFNVRCAAPP